MNAPIPLFVPTFRTEETLVAIRECLEKGWTGLGYKTLEFEEAWKAYTGLPHAHFLNSATAGLHLAVAQMKQEYNWSDEGEIITTPLTFVSTNHAILHAGLTPIFADVDTTMCLDPRSVEQAITPYTKAVMFVGLGGNVGQWWAIKSLCEDRGLKLILDASHMAGTQLHTHAIPASVHAGFGADVSVFSFQAVKNLPTADSGMICWRDTGMDAKSRKLSWLGIDKDTYARSSGTGYSWRYDVEEVGWKYNGNSIMAAMGLVALKYLDADNEYRRTLAKAYDELLPSEYGRVPMSPDCTPSRHLYQVLVENRDSVVEQLRLVGIGTGVHYIDNTHYWMYKYQGHDKYCPNAVSASQRLLSLPMHLQMDVSDVGYIAQELKRIIEGAKA